MEVSSWQGQKDSNPQQRFWRPTCYHYTMPLSATFEIIWEKDSLVKWKIMLGTDDVKTAEGYD